MKHRFLVLFLNLAALLPGSIVAREAPEDVVYRIYIEAEKKYFKNEYTPLDPKDNPQYDFIAAALDGPSIYGIIARLVVKVDVESEKIRTVSN